MAKQLESKLSITNKNDFLDLAAFAMEEPCTRLISEVAGIRPPVSFANRTNQSGWDIGRPDRVLDFPRGPVGEPTPFARIPVLYRSAWAMDAATTDLVDAVNKNLWKKDNSLVKTVSQLCAYMKYNRSMYGILSTLHHTHILRSTLFLPRGAAYAQEGFECSPPIYWGAEGLRSPLAAYVYAALLAYNEKPAELYPMTVSFKEPRKISYPIPNMVDETRGQTLEFRMEKQIRKDHASTTQGSVINKLDRDLQAPATFRVYDLSLPETAARFDHEVNMYHTLSELQGSAIPHLYIAGKIRGVLGILVLQDCGEILEDQLPSGTADMATRSLEAIHGCNVLHGGPSLKKFAYNPKDEHSPMKIFDLSDAALNFTTDKTKLDEELNHFKTSILSSQPTS
ncbi:hypothetical protein DRE_02811 [Drechslerella stenobrocha 248]|uniref:Protein kinase domain-containing protein n=1 Tax=Drechslerella stenobrocha 248 TaxID=1043628 RepID=W7HWK2_9PEZI|nr:hypothetical protein DRE_02811 [Drechslerella stenobrocha 248]